MDDRKHGFKLAQDLMVPKPHNLKPSRLRIMSSPPIRFNLRGMLSTIEFYDEPAFLTDKVNYEGANGVLSSELEPGQRSISQMVP